MAFTAQSAKWRAHSMSAIKGFHYSCEGNCLVLSRLSCFLSCRQIGGATHDRTRHTPLGVSCMSCRPMPGICRLEKSVENPPRDKRSDDATPRERGKSTDCAEHREQEARVHCLSTSAAMPSIWICKQSVFNFVENSSEYLRRERLDRVHLLSLPKYSKLEK